MHCFSVFVSPEKTRSPKRSTFVNPPCLAFRANGRMALSADSSLLGLVGLFGFRVFGDDDVLALDLEVRAEDEGIRRGVVTAARAFPDQEHRLALLVYIRNLGLLPFELEHDKDMSIEALTTNLGKPMGGNTKVNWQDKNMPICDFAASHESDQ